MGSPYHHLIFCDDFCEFAESIPEKFSKMQIQLVINVVIIILPEKGGSINGNLETK